MKNFLKIFFIAVIFAGGGSFAQESDSIIFKTSEIKVISNRISTDIFNSPTKIELISREQIEHTNGETLSDVLKTVSGIFIKSYSANSGLSTISLNGMGAEHTLILLNGFKVNSFQNALLDLVTISKDDIDRIEIMNNGASSLYGSEAMGGVVNIITKKPSVNDLNLKLNYQIGSYNLSKYLFSAGKNFKYFFIQYSQSLEKSDNDYDFDTGDWLTKIASRKNADYKIKNYSFRGSAKISGNSSLNIFSFYSNIFRKIPGTFSLFTETSRAEQKDRNWFNTISFETKLENDLNLISAFNFQNNLMNYFNGYTSSSYYKNLVYSLNTLAEKKFQDFKINSGAELTYATIKSNELESNVKRYQSGIFTVVEIDLDKFKIFPSARFDHISDINENVFTGKMGVNYKPFKNEDIHFRFSAGNNFSAPTFNELYWKDFGNKALKPERSVNFDAGFIYEVHPGILVDAEYTKIFTNDKIVWRPVSSTIWKPFNIGKSESDVISFSAEIKKIFPGELLFRVKQNYTHTSSIKKSKDFENDPSFGKQIFYIPVETAKTEAEIKYKEIGLNFFYSMIGKRFTDFENRYFLPAADIVDGNIFFKITNPDNISMTVKVEVNNLFNTDYEIIDGYPMPLRNYKLNLTFEY